MDMHVRGRGFSINEAVKDAIRRRLDFSLGRFDDEIRRVDVRLSELGGPTGREEKCCQLDVHLARGGSLWVREEGKLFTPAIQRAAHRVGRVLARTVAKRSMFA